jgi:oxalate decarboxylase/phosphoglucose isomerase-like protein (cupin superfamily)
MKNKEYSALVDKQQYPADILVPIDDIFKDDRGEIINLLFSPVSSVAIITSKKGTIRSNHWHKSSWHYLYVVSGQMKYFERDLNGTEITEIICNPGDMVFTAPYKAHRTEFLQDTVLVSLGKEPKDHENHEKDIVKIEF